MCGTLEYMSPEVLNCSRASTAVDTWGLGVIAYLLVSGGVSPFMAPSNDSTHPTQLPRLIKLRHQISLIG